MTIQNKSQKLRYGAVGIVNTAIDFGLLFGLNGLGLHPAIANIVSTTAAFCFSFLANKKVTFKTTGTNLKREITLFIVVTLFGLWVLQTIVISIVGLVLSHSGLADSLILLIGKLVASCVTIVWNYTLYSKVVFKDHG